MVKIFSIKNEYCAKIFDNKKLVELRRQNIKIRENEKCLIYTTHPVKKLTGYFIVKDKIRLPIKKLWIEIKDIAGITKSQFMDYFQGCIEGTAIFFKYVKKFINELSLDEMKSLVKGFRPPQSYSNINENIYNLFIKNAGDSVITLSMF